MQPKTIMFLTTNDAKPVFKYLAESISDIAKQFKKEHVNVHVIELNRDKIPVKSYSAIFPTNQIREVREYTS